MAKNEVNCWACGNVVSDLPEGAKVPDPEYTLLDLTFDQTTGVTIATSEVVMVYCRACPGGKILDQYYKRARRRKSS